MQTHHADDFKSSGCFFIWGGRDLFLFEIEL